ncbi:MAG: trimethylamine methyltransferase family protein [Candidatus Bathyarchaeia archaeon]
MVKCQKVKKPLEILTKEDLEKIHQTSIRILNGIGVKMDDSHIVRLFKEHGCEVDEKNRIVKINEELIKEHLKKIPKVFTISSRIGEKMNVGNGSFYMISPSDNNYVLDIENGTRRPANLKDCSEMARLVDALEFFHGVSTPVLPHEFPPKIRCIYAAATTLRNTIKHYEPEPTSIMEAKYIIKMVEAIVGGEEELIKNPITSTVICPIAPLQFPESSLYTLMEYAKRKLPLQVMSAPILGVSSPITMAGSLALSNAENLSGITLIELISNGSPVYYGGSNIPFDMSAGNSAAGAMEFNILSIAEAQLARFYGIPAYGAGGTTNAKLGDAQCGYEKMASTLLSYLAGYDMVVETSLDNHSLYAYEDLIIQNEIAGMVMRFGNAFQVSDETIAFDTIKKVGIGGNFLGEKHTRIHAKTDFWYSKLPNRSTYEEWLAKGGKELRINAIEQAKKLLAEHQPIPLDRDIDNKIDEILKEARKEAGV